MSVPLAVSCDTHHSQGPGCVVGVHHLHHSSKGPDTLSGSAVRNAACLVILVMSDGLVLPQVDTISDGSVTTIEGKFHCFTEVGVCRCNEVEE